MRAQRAASPALRSVRPSQPPFAQHTTLSHNTGTPHTPHTPHNTRSQRFSQYGHQGEGESHGEEIASRPLRLSPAAANSDAGRLFAARAARQQQQQQYTLSQTQTPAYTQQQQQGLRSPPFSVARFVHSPPPPSDRERDRDREREFQGIAEEDYDEQGEYTHAHAHAHAEEDYFHNLETEHTHAHAEEETERDRHMHTDTHTDVDPQDVSQYAALFESPHTSPEPAKRDKHRLGANSAAQKNRERERERQMERERVRERERERALQRQRGALTPSRVVRDRERFGEGERPLHSHTHTLLDDNPHALDGLPPSPSVHSLTRSLTRSLHTLSLSALSQQHHTHGRTLSRSQSRPRIPVELLKERLDSPHYRGKGERPRSSSPVIWGGRGTRGRTPSREEQREREREKEQERLRSLSLRQEEFNRLRSTSVERIFADRERELAARAQAERKAQREREREIEREMEMEKEREQRMQRMLRARTPVRDRENARATPSRIPTRTQTPTQRERRAEKERERGEGVVPPLALNTLSAQRTASRDTVGDTMRESARNTERDTQKGVQRAATRESVRASAESELAGLGLTLTDLDTERERDSLYVSESVSRSLSLTPRSSRTPRGRTERVSFAGNERNSESETETARDNARGRSVTPPITPRERDRERDRSVTPRGVPPLSARSTGTAADTHSLSQSPSRTLSRTLSQSESVSVSVSALQKDKVRAAAQSIMQLSPPQGSSDARSKSPKRGVSFSSQSERGGPTGALGTAAGAGEVVKTGEEEDYWSLPRYQRALYLVDYSARQSFERIYEANIRLVVLTWSLFCRFCDLALSDTQTHAHSLSLSQSAKERLREGRERIASLLAEKEVSQSETEDRKLPAHYSSSFSANFRSISPTKLSSNTTSDAACKEREKMWFFLRRDFVLSPVLPYSPADFSWQRDLFFRCRSLSLAVLGHAGGEKAQLLKHDLAWTALSLSRSPFALYAQLREHVNRHTLVKSTAANGRAAGNKMEPRGVQDALPPLYIRGNDDLDDDDDSDGRESADSLTVVLVYPSHAQLLRTLRECASLFLGASLSLVHCGFSTEIGGNWLLGDESEFSARECVRVLSRSLSLPHTSVSLTLHSLHSDVWTRDFVCTCVARMRGRETDRDTDNNNAGNEGEGAEVGRETDGMRAIPIESFSPLSSLSEIEKAEIGVIDTSLTLHGQCESVRVSIAPFDVQGSRSFAALRACVERLTDTNAYAQALTPRERETESAWSRWQQLDGQFLCQTLSSYTTTSATMPLSAYSTRYPYLSMPTSLAQSLALTHGHSHKQNGARPRLPLLQRIKGPRLFLFSARCGGGALFVWREKDVYLCVGGARGDSDAAERERERVLARLPLSLLCLTHCAGDSQTHSLRQLLRRQTDRDREFELRRTQASTDAQTHLQTESERETDEDSIETCFLRVKSVFGLFGDVAEKTTTPSDARGRGRERDRENLSRTQSETMLRNTQEELPPSRAQLGRDWTLSRSLSVTCQQAGVTVYREGSLSLGNGSVIVHALPPIERSLSLSRAVSRNRSRSRSPSHSLTRTPARSHSLSRAASAASLLHTQTQTQTQTQPRASTPTLTRSHSNISLSSTQQHTQQPTLSLASPLSHLTDRRHAQSLPIILEVREKDGPPLLLLFTGQCPPDVLAERLSVWRRRTHRDTQRVEFLFAEMPHFPAYTYDPLFSQSLFENRKTPPSLTHVLRLSRALWQREREREYQRFTQFVRAEVYGVMREKRISGEEVQEHDMDNAFTEENAFALLGQRVVFNWRESETFASRAPLTQPNARTAPSQQRVCPAQFAEMHNLQSWYWPRERDAQREKGREREKDRDAHAVMEVGFDPHPPVNSLPLRSLL